MWRRHGAQCRYAPSYSPHFLRRNLPAGNKRENNFCTLRVFQYFGASAPGTISSGSLHRSSITKMTVSASFLDMEIIGGQGPIATSSRGSRLTMICSTVSLCLGALWLGRRVCKRRNPDFLMQLKHSLEVEPTYGSLEVASRTPSSN